MSEYQAKNATKRGFSDLGVHDMESATVAARRTEDDWYAADMKNAIRTTVCGRNKRNSNATVARLLQAQIRTIQSATNATHSFRSVALLRLVRWA